MAIVVRSPQAELDLEELAEYIARRQPRIALLFLYAAEKAFALHADFPEIGGKWTSKAPRLADLRVWRVPGFRHHLIFYRIVGEEVQVVRVLWGTRDLEKLL